MLIFKILLLSVILELFKSQDNSQLICPVFYCTNIEAPTGGVCFTNAKYFNNSILQLKTCPPNQECIFNALNPVGYNSVSCTSIQFNFYSRSNYGNLVEQDFCKTDNQCASNNCSDSFFCIGFLQGVSCSNSKQCSALTYCDISNTKQCQNRKLVDSTCVKDEECVNSSECFKGVCVLLFTLPAGTDVKFQNRTQFCYSNYTKNGICEDLLNKGTFPYFCDAILGCNYTTSLSNNVYHNDDRCNCDYSGNGFAYCSLGTTSQIWANSVSLVKQTLNYPCHFYNKYRCFLTPYNLTLGIFNLFNDISQTSTDMKCLLPVNPTFNPGILCPDNLCKGSFFRINILLIIFILYIIIT